MSAVLYEHLTRKIALTPEEFAFIAQQFTRRTLRRKERLLQAGEPAHHVAFVERGLLHSFAPDERGAERTSQFAFEGGWIGDTYSSLTGEPATLTIEALEDSTVLLIDQAGQERIYAQVPRYERYQRLLLQNHLIVVYRRLLNSLNASAEAKYDDLLARHPTIAQRVPLHLIASYLGISPESLSRIRARKAGRG